MKTSTGITWIIIGILVAALGIWQLRTGDNSLSVLWGSVTVLGWLAIVLPVAVFISQPKQ